MSRYLRKVLVLVKETVPLFSRKERGHNGAYCNDGLHVNVASKFSKK